MTGKRKASRHGMLTGSMMFFISVLLYARTVMSLSEGEKAPAECRVHKSVITPAALKAELPADAAVLEVVSTARNAIRNILDDKDDRLLVIVGPCSIHDPTAAMDYAARLASFSHQHSQHLVIVMRTYFEKPRTRLGWKGLINDPALDGTFDMALGLRLARKLLLDINKLGLPCATEFLDPLVPSYISDLIAWGSTGARTVYSQVHREMTSGLEMPVGMKHDVFGNVDAAIDSLVSAAAPHAHLAMNQAGSISQATTTGNLHAHLVLRGGTGGSNYDLTSITRASTILSQLRLPSKVLVDCSHGNSNKVPSNQRKAVNMLLQLLQQHQPARGGNEKKGKQQPKIGGKFPLAGVMLESYIKEGSQPAPLNRSQVEQLEYGVSVTDACMSWEQTEELLRALSTTVEVFHMRAHEVASS